MSAKHTPGPWIVSDMNKVPLGASTLATVAHVGDYQIGIETGRPGGDYRSGLHGDEAADAALIAAAPELLEALREARDFVEPCVPSGDDLLARINAAIAQAEGHQ